MDFVANGWHGTVGDACHRLRLQGKRRYDWPGWPVTSRSRPDPNDNSLLWVCVEASAWKALAIAAMDFDLDKA